MKLNLAIGTMLAAFTAIPGAVGQTASPRTHNAQVLTMSNTPYLGVGVRDIDSDSMKKFNLKEMRGAEVTSVSEESPAAKAGLKAGDVILEFNGQPIEGQEQLSRMVRETPVGRQVKIGVWRNGGMQALTATVEARKGSSFNNGPWTSIPDIQIPDQLRSFRFPDMPDFQGFSMSIGSPVLGIMGEPLGQQEQLAEFFGVKDGVLVKSVNRNSAAEKAGIKAGDVIVKVDDATVASSRDISSALRAARSKKSVTVMVVRNHKEMPISVTLEAGTNLSGNPVHAGLVVGPRYIMIGRPGPVVAGPKLALARLTVLENGEIFCLVGPRARPLQVGVRPWRLQLFRHDRVI
jgi:serine protease Do